MERPDSAHHPRTSTRPVPQRPRRQPMAASNINRVVLTGNLTRDPELRSTPVRHRGLQPADRVQHAPQDQRRRVGRQAQLLQRHRLGRPGRELRPLPHQGPPGRDRRPPGLARMDRRTTPSARPSRSSPTPSSSSPAARTAAKRRAGGARRRRHRVLKPIGPVRVEQPRPRAPATHESNHRSQR